MEALLRVDELPVAVDAEFALLRWHKVIGHLFCFVRSLVGDQISFFWFCHKTFVFTFVDDGEADSPFSDSKIKNTVSET